MSEISKKYEALVMSMDDDEAQTFVTMVTTDLLNADIAKNQATLQRHLDRVISKRADDVAKALDRAYVSKAMSGGPDEHSLAMVGAFAEINKARQKNPYEYGFQFDENKIKRNSSGQFTVKVKPTQNRRPLDQSQARMAGIPEPKHQKPMSRADRARYQAEYAQVAAALGAFSGGTQVQLQVQPKKGNGSTRTTESMNAKNVKNDGIGWDPSTERLVGVKVERDYGLGVGGAAFDLTTALGGSAEGGAKIGGALDAAGGQANAFANTWTGEVADGSNRGLYNRLRAGSELLAQVAPFSPKAQTAAAFGNFVGSYGPEAERVVGPAARKTAYRYRGVTKEPDAALKSQYARDTARVRRASGDNPNLSSEQKKELGTKQKRAATAARNAKAARLGRPASAVELDRAEKQRVYRNTEAQYRKDNPVQSAPSDRGPGRATVQTYLASRIPDRKRYNLQLESGHVPPSEGVIIDANGDLAAQAVGYADDHYLPFNLKQLKALKGGEYVRNRSLGGLTSEDIYTGLMSGAAAVTVVSRSGTFTMEFEDDFKGTRRFNDKAARMTDRYELLLDAVRSKQVDREAHLDDWAATAIEAKVKRDAGPYASPTSIREQIESAQKEYQNSEGMTEIDDMIVDAKLNRLGEMSDAERRVKTAEFRNFQLASKEFKYRLNGEGYKEALFALHEQFPYYLKEPKVVPTKDLERKELSIDRGYVAPGRNRPTAARDSYFDERAAGNKGRAGGVAMSAADTKYQGRAGSRAAAEPVSREDAVATTVASGQSAPAVSEQDKVAAKIQQTQSQMSYADAAEGLLDDALVGQLGTGEPALKGKSKDEIVSLLREGNPDATTQFNAFVAEMAPQLSEGSYPERLVAFRSAKGELDRRDYDSNAPFLVPEQPYRFPGKIYTKKGDPAEQSARIEDLGGRLKELGTKPLAQQTGEELKTELKNLERLSTVQSKGLGTEATKELVRGMGIDPENRTAKLAMTDPGQFKRHVEDVHKIRTLRSLAGEPAKVEPTRITSPAANEPPSAAVTRDAAVKAQQQVDDAYSTADAMLADADFDQAVKLKAIKTGLESDSTEAQMKAYHDLKVLRGER